MKYLIAISGPVASGKSVLATEITKRFKTYRISTRQLLIDAGIPNERQALIEAGKRLDAETNGTWIRDGSFPYVKTNENTHDVILIDAIRTEPQADHLREQFGERFIHIHVAVPYAVAKERYEARALPWDKDVPYDLVREDPTEKGVWMLHLIADRVVQNVQCDPASLLARATAGLHLFPDQPSKSVDVLVGGQFGSEGKGNISAYLARDYDLLMRVGGPNAGHMVAYPPQKYVQLPSGTRSNPNAKILIGAGATIWPEQMLKEIAECGLDKRKERLAIDEQAMIIEPFDRELEAGLLELDRLDQAGGGRRYRAKDYRSWKKVAIWRQSQACPRLSRA